MGKRIITGATGAITSAPDDLGNTCFQSTVTGTGAVSASVRVDVSNDGVGWMQAGTRNPSGTTTAADGCVIGAGWDMVRVAVVSVSGTAAAVDVTAGA